MKLYIKYIGALFLFLAGLMLFAHSIVPHHHQNEQVYLEIFACQHHDLPLTNDHQHGDNNHRCCILNQLVVIPNNQWKQECGYFASNNYAHDLVILIPGCTPGLFNTFNVACIPAPEIIHNSFKIPVSSQLRAPPAV